MPRDIDAAWTLKDALQVARELERLGVYWIEEPLHRADRAGMKALRAMTGLRIAGGEMNRELHEFRDLIAESCLDVLQPDANLVGGLTGLRRVAIMAAEHNLAFTPHTWGPGTGVIANAHLACGLAGSAYLEFPWDPPGWDLERRDFMLAKPFDIDAEGWLVLSDAAGMGYELNESLLAKTRVG
jgi:L-alanine-DL-glutamate epimerase-like enolase superfamily enzyme